MQIQSSLRSLIYLVAFVALVATCSLAPHFANAHGDGASWEVPSGEYVADVGYDPGEFIAGEYTLFDFDLKKSDSTAVAFAEAWVRIKSTNDTYLATGIRKQPSGPTTLLYTFTTPGNYTLEVSYRDANSNELAVVSLPLTVGEGDKAGSSVWLFCLVSVLVGMVAGTVGSSLFSRRK